MSNPRPGTRISKPVFGCELFVAQSNLITPHPKFQRELFTSQTGVRRFISATQIRTGIQAENQEEYAIMSRSIHTTRKSLAQLAKKKFASAMKKLTPLAKHGANSIVSDELRGRSRMNVGFLGRLWPELIPTAFRLKCTTQASMCITVFRWKIYERFWKCCHQPRQKELPPSN